MGHKLIETRSNLIPGSAAVREETQALIEKLSDVRVSFAKAQDSISPSKL